MDQPGLKPSQTQSKTDRFRERKIVTDILTLIFFTFREAAAKYGGSELTLRRMVDSGRGPIVTRIGGKNLVREDHFREWLESCATTAPFRKQHRTKRQGSNRVVNAA